MDYRSNINAWIGTNGNGNGSNGHKDSNITNGNDELNKGWFWKRRKPAVSKQILNNGNHHKYYSFYIIDYSYSHKYLLFTKRN